VLNFFILQALFLSAQYLYEKKEGSGSVPLTPNTGSSYESSVIWIGKPDVYRSQTLPCWLWVGRGAKTTENKNICCPIALDHLNIGQYKLTTEPAEYNKF
jgi:hypothetical protein